MMYFAVVSDGGLAILDVVSKNGIFITLIDNIQNKSSNQMICSANT